MAEDLVHALQRLADESRPIAVASLTALSDMPRRQAEVFRAAWTTSSPRRRLELVRALVEAAEANIHFNFYAILREVLRDPDPQVRTLAIHGLWEDDRPSLVEPLAALASDDPVPEVRAAAAMSLGRFVLLGALGEIAEAPAGRAEQALRSAWHRAGEAVEVRRRALEGLAYADAGDVRELIHMAYYDEDALLQQSAMLAMGRTADRYWARFVLEELASAELAMRREAAVAAGELALAAAVPSLIRLLNDADGEVRRAATAALGEIGGAAARRALQQAERDADPDQDRAAGEALQVLEFNSGGVSDSMFDFNLQHAGADEQEDGDSDGAADGEIYDYDQDAVDWLDDE